MFNVLLLQTNPPVQDVSLWGGFFRVFGLLAVLLFACYLLLRYMGRRAGSLREQSPGGRLELIDRLGLEPRRSVYVLRVGSRYVAIASTEAGVQVLMELSPDAVQSPSPAVERGQPS
jgi:flagellar biogenesis protein FliO